MDTDAMRAEIEALPAGAQRDAALSHLAAAEQHLTAAQSWADSARALAEMQGEESEPA